MARPCEILLTPTAERLLKALDHAVFLIIQQAVKKLQAAPELGKPLAGDLKGLHSWKVSRYRLVYAWRPGMPKIVLVGAGIRKEGDRHDIYAVLRKLRDQGLLTELLRLLP